MALDIKKIGHSSFAQDRVERNGRLIAESYACDVSGPPAHGPEPRHLLRLDSDVENRVRNSSNRVHHRIFVNHIPWQSRLSSKQQGADEEREVLNGVLVGSLLALNRIELGACQLAGFECRLAEVGQVMTWILIVVEAETDFDTPRREKHVG